MTPGMVENLRGLWPLGGMILAIYAIAAVCAYLGGCITWQW